MNIGNNYSVVEFLCENGEMLKDYVIAEGLTLDEAIAEIDCQHKQIRRFNCHRGGGEVHDEKLLGGWFCQGFWSETERDNIIGVYLKEKSFGVSRRVEKMIEHALECSKKL